MVALSYRLAVLSCLSLLSTDAVPEHQIHHQGSQHPEPEASNAGMGGRAVDTTSMNGSQKMTEVQPAGREPATQTVSTEVVTAQDPCLSLCSCNTLTKQVDCSSRALPHIPAGLPSDVHYLDLSKNNLSRIEVSDLERFWQLQQLDLSFNHLSVSASVFSASQHLRSLYIQHNHLDDTFFLCPDDSAMSNSDNNTDQDGLTSLVLCNITSLELLDITYNNLTALPTGLLEGYPQLEVLLLDYNKLEKLPELTDTPHPLQHLSVSYNDLDMLDCAGVTHLNDLRHLDLGYNKLGNLPVAFCSKALSSLTTLTLSGNPFNALSPGAFSNLTSLTMMYLTHLDGLRYLPADVFKGLPNLQKLLLSHNEELGIIHADAFAELSSLEVLDLSDCGLSWLHKNVFSSLSSMRVIKLEGNPWSCNCHLAWLPNWLHQRFGLNTQHRKLVCTVPPHMRGDNLLNTSYSMECQNPMIVDLNVTQFIRIGQPAVVNCLEEGNPQVPVVWQTSKGERFVYDPGYHNLYESDPFRPRYHDDHEWHGDGGYYPTLEYTDRIKVLYNGSLYIDYSTRHDAGNYTCYLYDGDTNQTAVIEVRINSRIHWFKVLSMVIGFIVAFTFFFITMVALAIYSICVRCSAKERKKRKSIREVLNSLHDFKTVQIDRLCAYKTAKFNKLSAFKNAKIHKLVAFKSAKVDKLRNYKQVTVASIFHHLEKMREHYNSQMNKVKDNCSQQMEKLRENYSNQVDKIKDYKVEKMDRLRDNYNNQIFKIRDYRTFQMIKLRDQYKVQQQHLLKLMELLDIGNCLNVVEAECQRTESMIFNPNISFDIEPEPVHIQRNMDLSDVESDYVTAGSQSDLSVSDNTFTAREHQVQKQIGGKHHDKTVRSHTNKSRHHYRGRHLHCSMSQSSSEASLSRPTHVDRSEPPPPPMFSCELPELDNLPLEQLVSDAEEAAEYFADIEPDDSESDIQGVVSYYADPDSDDISIYQTPPVSAHQDMASNTAQVVPSDIGQTQQSLSPCDDQPAPCSPQPTHNDKHSDQQVQLERETKKETIV